jgi:ADP-heptose:LPS heptosyltransferase
MDNPKKILLVQLFSNGDCLYATAVARQIKQDCPGCHLTWAISDFCKNIISGNPYVDAVRAVNEVIKNDVITFRKFKKKVFTEKRRGLWDDVIVTHNMDENQALYDGTIRGMIFRAYGKPVTVPVQPVLILDDEEKQNVRQFTERHHLAAFKNIILWEFAPQSGQAILNFDFVMQIAKKIIEVPNTCVILSSALAFESIDKIIDASNLSVRENAALTHYCSLLVGCSSGITWISTSSAAKQLPMLQLLNPLTPFLNAPSVDFKRYQISPAGLIEITTIKEDRILACVKMIIDGDFNTAKTKFNEDLPLQFNTTRKIVYNLLCYLHLKAIGRHYKIITSIYGKHPEFIKQFTLAILTFPFKLIRNKWRKRSES